MTSRIGTPIIICVKKMCFFFSQTPFTPFLSGDRVATKTLSSGMPSHSLTLRPWWSLMQQQRLLLLGLKLLTMGWLRVLH